MRARLRASAVADGRPLGHPGVSYPDRVMAARARRRQGAFPRLLLVTEGELAYSSSCSSFSGRNDSLLRSPVTRFSVIID